MRFVRPLLSAVVFAAAACAAPEASTFGDGKGPSSGDGAPMFDPTVVPTDFAHCAKRTSAAEGKPLYLVFAYDDSGSMIIRNSPKWAAAKAAAKAFFASADARNVHASLSFFPNAMPTQEYSCEPNDYASPQVPMTSLPSGAFADELDRHMPIEGAGTPMYVALEGAHRYASVSTGVRDSDTTTAVVIVTDGIPDSSCQGNSVGEVRDLAGQRARSVRTFVIGVGTRLTDLNAIAAAGGTKAAILVDTRDAEQIERDVLAAINAVRRRALECDYTIPPAPEGQELDRDLVNVIHTENGKPQAIGYSAGCGDPNGWRYDDPAAPKRILLCNASCETVRESKGRVDVLFGCATKQVVVR
jgi:Mg-chelatase subunit ChlD